MIYQVYKILQDVRTCLDENKQTNALLVGNDVETLSLDDIIESKILEAVERVECEAPYYLLEQGHNFFNANDVVYWGSMESGYVLLPNDFMRLVVFEMSDWERPVYTVITPADPLYQRQSSRIKGVRGTAQKPVCAIAVRPEGRTLEFYSCKTTNAVVVKAVYIPHPVISAVNSQRGVDISERCYTAVVYTCAALTLVSCGEAEQAKSMFEMAKTYLTK